MTPDLLIFSHYQWTAAMHAQCTDVAFRDGGGLLYISLNWINDQMWGFMITCHPTMFSCRILFLSYFTFTVGMSAQCTTVHTGRISDRAINEPLRSFSISEMVPTCYSDRNWKCKRLLACSSPGTVNVKAVVVAFNKQKVLGLIDYENFAYVLLQL